MGGHASGTEGHIQMRIVYYSTPAFADCDFPLIRAMRDRGHEVYYIIRVAPFSMKSTIMEIDELDKVSRIVPGRQCKWLSGAEEWIDLDRTYVSNDATGKTGFASFKLFLQERQLVKSISPDVFQHVGIPGAFQLSFFTGRRTRKVCVIHDPLPHTGEHSIRKELKKRILLKLSPEIILLSSRLSDSFCRKYGVKESRVHIASLGPYEYYCAFRTGRRFDSRHILLFGRLSPYKGIDFALEAFSRIQGQFPGIKLIIAGAGPVCFDWSRYEGNGRVEFIHRYLTVEEIADYVSAAEFVVCPYTDATQSGVANTSFALGSPVLATAVGSFPELVDDGKTGLIVPPRDAGKLAEAMSHLLGTPGLLDQMRQNIAEELRTGHLSWTDIAKVYEKVYSR